MRVQLPLDQCQGHNTYVYVYKSAHMRTPREPAREIDKNTDAAKCQHLGTRHNGDLGVPCPLLVTFLYVGNYAQIKKKNNFKKEVCG